MVQTQQAFIARRAPAVGQRPSECSASPPLGLMREETERGDAADDHPESPKDVYPSPPPNVNRHLARFLAGEARELDWAGGVQQQLPRL